MWQEVGAGSCSARSGGHLDGHGAHPRLPAFLGKAPINGGRRESGSSRVAGNGGIAASQPAFPAGAGEQSRAGKAGASDRE